MKQILLFGAGKSATVLIDYLLVNAGKENWKVIVADADKKLVESKIKDSSFAKAVSFDITDEEKRGHYIGQSDIVISMLPPALHFLVASDCAKYSKHLLTASYVDEQIRSLKKEIEAKNLLFLCEMVLIPGLIT